MKIEDTHKVVANIFRHNKMAPGKETGNPTDASAKQVSGEENERLSYTVERLNKANAPVQFVTEFRADRVAALKSKIETGNYRVSSTTVAEKMLSRTNKGSFSDARNTS